MAQQVACGAGGVPVHWAVVRHLYPIYLLSVLAGAASLGATLPALAASGAGAPAVTFYVSPDGRDDWSGKRAEPAGRAGPGFIVTPNFYTLKSYNFSDNYALYVGHLADRMSNNRSFKGNWATTKGIQRGDVRRLQLHLESQGYNVGGADGLVGFRSRIAIGQWQEKLGRKVTCFPDRGLLKAVP